MTTDRHPIKLVIQVPCFNEEGTLAATLDRLPTTIPGVDVIDVVVIDDGSVDTTSAIARAHNVAAVVRFAGNRGLARAFTAGIDAALRRGADVIVNIDADGQYLGDEIPLLVTPILEGRADIVVGDRRPSTLRHFSPVKRWLQRLGSAVVRSASGTFVPDAASGFRAFSRDAALRIIVASDFSHTLETLIHAGAGRLTVASVPVTAQPTPRASRLAGSLAAYLEASGTTILQAWARYHPVRACLLLAAPGLAAGVCAWGCALTSNPHVRTLSVVFAGLAAVLGAATVAVLADLLGNHRRMLDDLHRRVRQMETARDAWPPTAPPP